MYLPFSLMNALATLPRQSQTMEEPVDSKRAAALQEIETHLKHLRMITTDPACKLHADMTIALLEKAIDLCQERGWGIPEEHASAVLTLPVAAMRLEMIRSLEALKALSLRSGPTYSHALQRAEGAVRNAKEHSVLTEDILREHPSFEADVAAHRDAFKNRLTETWNSLHQQAKPRGHPRGL